MESKENQSSTIESEQSLLFTKYGVIFAFSQSQFDEQGKRALNIQNAVWACLCRL
jgi:hypothetical protein